MEREFLEAAADVTPSDQPHLPPLTGEVARSAGRVSPAGETFQTGETPQSPCGDSLRPALPQMPFPGRLRSRPDNGAAAEIASRLDLPQAAAGRNSPVRGAYEAAAAYHARASAFAAARCRAWLAEAEALADAEPGFDLAAAGRSRVFTALLRAGLPLREAWRAANVDAVARRAAADARAALSADIRARGARPTEAGAAAMPAFAARPDVRRLTDAEVRDVLGRVERREHVSFG